MALPCHVLVKAHTFGSLAPPGQCPLGTRFPPVPIVGFVSLISGLSVVAAFTAVWLLASAPAFRSAHRALPYPVLASKPTCGSLSAFGGSPHWGPRFYRRAFHCRSRTRKTSHLRVASGFAAVPTGDTLPSGVPSVPHLSFACPLRGQCPLGTSVLSSPRPLPWPILVKPHTCGSLWPSAKSPLGTRFPPVSLRCPPSPERVNSGAKKRRRARSQSGARMCDAPARDFPSGICYDKASFARER
jgi:hypothetical protein